MNILANKIMGDVIEFVFLAKSKDHSVYDKPEWSFSIIEWIASVQTRYPRKSGITYAFSI